MAGNPPNLYILFHKTKSIVFRAMTQFSLDAEFWPVTNRKFALEPSIVLWQPPQGWEMIPGKGFFALLC